ncbi:hypothetical protein BGX27_009169 [Mortierella sp. AM989]|nr:hypothetical protein BGX27_009169 [Mortierella sp. AM989]
MLPASPIPSPLFQHMTHLTRHIATQGLEHGVGSDISIKVFGKTYHLHRLILTQSKFFESMLEGPWKERMLDLIEMRIDDTNITNDGFDIAIRSLYGVCPDAGEQGEHGTMAESSNFQESSTKEIDGNEGNKNTISTTSMTPGNAFSVLASGVYLGIERLCEQCTTFMVRTISANHILQYVQFCDSASYYPWSDRIADACHTFLCRNGFDEPKIKCHRVFETLPSQWLLRILKSDAFWIPNEWERYKFCRGVVHNRRKKKKLEKLEKLSNSQRANCHEGIKIGSIANEDEDDDEDVYDIMFSTCIRYMHMSFEQLRVVLLDHDPITGESFTRPEIIHKALWQQTELRALISRCSKKDGSLGIIVEDDSMDSVKQENRTPESQEGETLDWLHEPIPSQDRTLLGDICSPTRRLVADDGPSSDFEDGSSSDSEDGSSSDSENALITPQRSVYAPFRFSVEFEYVDLLQVDVRVFSDKVFYAGSFWDVQIKKIQSPEGPKFSVYLCRNSLIPILFIASRPISKLGFGKQHQQVATQGGFQSNHREKGIEVEENRGFAQHLDIPDIEENGLVPIRESVSYYVDKRDKSKTWFKIFAASIGPLHTITQFHGKADDFSVGPERGWSSSCLYSKTKLQTACSGPSQQRNQKNSGDTTSNTRIHVQSVNDFKDGDDDTSEAQPKEALDFNCSCVAQQELGNHHHHPLLPFTLRLSIVMGHI